MQPNLSSPFSSDANRRLDETAAAVSTLASMPTEPMTDSVRLRQRAEILAQAGAHMPQVGADIASDPSQKTPFHQVFWQTLRASFAMRSAGFAMAMMLLIVFGVSVHMGLFGGSDSQRLVSLHIPEAHAQDAFSLSPELADGGGMATSSAFILKSAVPVTSKQVRQVVKINPPVPFEVEAVSDKEYRLKPRVDLSEGTVYRVELAAAVEKQDGSLQPRDFSWAIQTTQDFKVLSTIPGDRMGDVPVNTGIEFKMSRDGWEDATSSFSIVPGVKGHFETFGRTLAFVPDAPLAFGTRYTVTLKKGFRIAHSNQFLQEDSVMRFETQATASSSIVDATKRPIAMDEFFEADPSGDIVIATNEFPQVTASKAAEVLDVQGFALTPDQARTLLERRLEIPEWATVERSRYEAYTGLGTRPAFHITTGLQEQGYGMVLRLPRIQTSGLYALRIKQSLSGTVQWAFLQVHGFASQVVVDPHQTIVWTIDTVTRKPLSQVVFWSGTGTLATSDATGVASFPTPDILKTVSTSTENASRVLVVELTHGGEHGFLLLRKLHPSWARVDAFSPAQDGLTDTWGYLYRDRPIYREDDEMHVFGLVRDRDDKSVPSDVSVRILRPMFWFDMGTGEPHFYKNVPLTPDADGRFEATIPWKLFAAGYYQVGLYRGETLITSESFEVRAWPKPAYFINITPSAKQVFGGDVVTGKIEVSLFNGTPMSRAKITLSAQQGWGSQGPAEQALVTDENGIATFRVPTVKSFCTSENTNNEACYGQSWLRLEARPTNGEEGEIVGNATVEIHAAELAIDVQTAVTGTQAEISVITKKEDASVAADGWRPWAGRELAVEVRSLYWESVQRGVNYDPITKLTTPMYHYEQRVEFVRPLTVLTNEEGQASFRFPIIKDARDRWYQVTVSGKDDLGRVRQEQTTVGTSYFSYTPDGSARFARLAFLRPGTSYAYALGESVDAQYQIGEKSLSINETSGVLFVVAHRGISDVRYVNGSDLHLTMSEALVPNATIMAYTYRDGRFEQVQNSFYLDTKEKKLELETTLDRETYAPGSSVTVKTRVRDSRGVPVANTNVAFSVVDTALLALAPYQTNEDPLAKLYAPLQDQILLTQNSRETANAMADGMGGGGSGDGQGLVRRLFKDQAAFIVGQTNQAGEVTVTFTLPDNVTTWRLEAVALSTDLRAGAVVKDVVVTKPVFVDAVIPSMMLVGDAPVIKLRAFGPGLSSDMPVTFSVDAPSLGINKQMLSTIGTKPVYLNVSAKTAGVHAMIVRGSTPSASDAIERTMTVLESRTTKTVLRTIAATPGLTLTRSLDASETEIVFMGPARARVRATLEDLTQANQMRVDAFVAARMSEATLREVFGVTTTVTSTTLAAKYQDYDGGIKLLPYGSSDLELSSLIAGSAPELFDREGLRNYFWNKFDARAVQSSSTREQRMYALSGLAALGEPVLPSLEIYASAPDLSWRESLAIARGYVMSGHVEAARRVLDRLLEGVTSQDGLAEVRVSSSPSETIIATAEAAALAARLSHPLAADLQAAVEARFSSDVLPSLAKARYLRAVAPRLPLVPSRIQVDWGMGVKTFDLGRAWSEMITLNAEQRAAFRVIAVEGEVTIAYQESVSGVVESSPDLTLTRRFIYPAGQTIVQEGDVVRVELTTSFGALAQDGCYALNDYLPANMQAILSSQLFSSNVITPFESRDHDASFVICKQKEPYTFSYLARVISPGSFTAPAPVLQHLQFPGKATRGVDERLDVK